MKHLGIRPFCERPKFHQFVYLRAEVDAKLRDYVRCAATPSIDQPMTMGEALKALHILSSKFAAALRKSGHLRADKKGKFLVMTPEDIAEFRSKYVTSTELALTSGLGRSHKVIETLSKKGVEPICTHETHQGILFSRQEVDRAMEVPNA